MKHRNVVANFLFKRDNGTDLVALFRRSTHPNIRSYQDKYAPISGSIEATDSIPRVAAIREIEEETTLIANRDITLAFVGKPFSFEDEDSQRSWTVYPFGWDLNVDDNSITLDWEHSGWDWFDPQRVLDGSIADQCVPNLHKSLQRVYFGLNGMFRHTAFLVNRETNAGQLFLKNVHVLRNNFKAGARELATDALYGLGQVVRTLNDVQSGDLWLLTRLASYHLVYSARPSMNAAIGAAIISVLGELASRGAKASFNTEQVANLFSGFAQDRSGLSDRVLKEFANFIRKQMSRKLHGQPAAEKQPGVLDIITVSSSSTITAVLQDLLTNEPFPAGSLIQVTFLESRPAFEGAKAAAKLLAFLHEHYAGRERSDASHPRINVKVVPESHIHLVLSRPATINPNQVKLILLGADRITPTGHVVNKVGSAALADINMHEFSARKYEVVVLSETDKIAAPAEQNRSQYLEYLARTKHHDRPSDEVREMYYKLEEKELQAVDYERHAASEVSQAWPEDVKTIFEDATRRKGETGAPNVSGEVDNAYFEPVENRYIARYISEKGELTRTQIFEISMERAKLEEELFGDLYD